MRRKTLDALSELKGLLHILEPKEKAVLLLRTVGGVHMKDVAVALHIGLARAYALDARARKKIKGAVRVEGEGSESDMEYTALSFPVDCERYGGQTGRIEKNPALELVGEYTKTQAQGIRIRSR